MNPTLDITVVFPYYNENQTILKTLELISMQTRMPAEVIFVNSSSTDKTSNTIDQWIEQNQENYNTVFYNLFEGTNTPSSSKNIGIKKGRSNWIAFMDCGLLFPIDWLDKQWDCIQGKDVQVVSGVCYLEGDGIIDSAAVAQTYGLKRNRPCIPSSVVNKSVFKKTDLFLENRRAGYDVAWALLLKKLDIRRFINSDIIVNYNGVNYGNTLIGIFKKSITYSIPLVNLKDYHIPYYYLLFMAIFATILNIYYSVFLISIYFFIRGFVIPIIKSSGIRFLIEKPKIIFLLPFMGMIIDTGKIIGFIIGIIKYHSIFKTHNKR